MQICIWLRLLWNNFRMYNCIIMYDIQYIYFSWMTFLNIKSFGLWISIYLSICPFTRSDKFAASLFLIVFMFDLSPWTMSMSINMDMTLSSSGFRIWLNFSSLRNISMKNNHPWTVCLKHYDMQYRKKVDTSELTFGANPKREPRSIG